MIGGAAGLLWLFLALPAGGQSYSLTERPWKLQPLSGEPDPAWFEPGFDDSAWIAQKLPAQWQMLPQFEEKYGGQMIYRYPFDFNPAPGRNYWLRFNGVFYQGRVWLNGRKLGSHTGYFAPFEFEATDRLQAHNLLAVEVGSPSENTEQDHRYVTGVFGHWDVINSHRNAGGIWREVEVIETGAARLRNLWMGTAALEARSGGELEARIILSGELQASSAGARTLRVDLEPENFSGPGYHFEFELKATAGENAFSREFALLKPSLWWTWDRGRPDLYRVKVQSLWQGEAEDRAEFITGIRTIEKRCQPGQTKEGHCWQMVLNGEPIYFRGNNYAPADAYLARATPELYAQDVARMRQSYYNLIRVHAHVDRPELYDLCDRAGIMIWQDFPLQGGYQPEIESEAVAQAREMVQLLGSHPSIALWSCQNEPSGPQVKWNLKTLDPELKRTLEAADPTRPVNLASGVPLKTDGHIYFGWDMGKPDDFGRYLYAPLFRPWMAFITEFGSQAFPIYENSIRFMNPELRQINWSELADYHMFQRWRMDRQVALTEGMDLRAYIAATQAYQARLQKYYIDWIRSAKYEVNWGVVTYLFNDSNPAITWSVLDYWRAPKPAYSAVQQSFQPVYALARWRFAPYPVHRKIHLPIYVVNDLRESYAGSLEITLRHLGKEIVSRSLPVKLGPDQPATRVDTISFRPGQPGDYELRLLLRLEGEDRPVANLTLLQVGKEAKPRAQ
jgi:beta-mannosidase